MLALAALRYCQLSFENKTLTGITPRQSTSLAHQTIYHERETTPPSYTKVDGLHRSPLNFKQYPQNVSYTFYITMNTSLLKYSFFPIPSLSVKPEV
jgi:hypothetical protein